MIYLPNIQRLELEICRCELYHVMLQCLNASILSIMILKEGENETSEPSSDIYRLRNPPKQATDFC